MSVPPAAPADRNENSTKDPIGITGAMDRVLSKEAANSVIDCDLRVSFMWNIVFIVIYFEYFSYV
jgi:hypothetical protein